MTNSAVTGRPACPGKTRCRTDSVDLAAHPAVVAQARLRSRLVLRDWGLDAAAAEVAQVLSELVSNAVTATRDAGLSTGIRVTLTADDSGILIAVWDAAPSLPVQAAPDPASEHGRGLLLVDALSSWRDVHLIPAERGGGKLVRARIAFP